jgi:hypothetical protein
MPKVRDLGYRTGINAYAIFILLAVAILSIFGLRGAPFKSPPVEIFSDMDRQPKYKP